MGGILAIGQQMGLNLIMFVPYVVADELNNLINNSKNPKTRMICKEIIEFLSRKRLGWLYIQVASDMDQNLYRNVSRGSNNDNKILLIYHHILKVMILKPLFLSADRTLLSKIYQLGGLHLNETNQNRVMKYLDGYSKGKYR